MSPTRRPSSVAGLRRGVGQLPASEMTDAEVQQLAAPRAVKPVRVTLNFPPELFRQLDRWTDEAAVAIGEPRVGVQDAVRAMVHVIATGEARNAESRVLAQLCTALELQRRERAELRRKG